MNIVGLSISQLGKVNRRTMFFYLAVPTIPETKSGANFLAYKPMASLSTCHLGLWLGWQILLNNWKQTANDCVNASSVNMFKNRIDRYLIRAGYT